MTITDQVNDMVLRFQVVDRITGVLIGEFKSHVRASRKADTLDGLYGAYRYKVVEKGVAA